jgi:AcrR family transcriptional regulator
MPGKATRYHHGNLRRVLLDAALALIEKQGLGALSLRELARKAGVTHAAPYRHFRDREALIVAIAIEGFQGLGREMAAATEGLSDPVDRFRALGLAYARYAVTHPAHFRVMFSSELNRSRDSAELTAAGEPTLASLVAVLAEAQAAGELGPGDPRAMAIPAWSMVHGLSMLLVDGQLGALFGDTQPDVGGLATLVADVLLRGLASERPGRPRARR